MKSPALRVLSLAYPFLPLFLCALLALALGAGLNLLLPEILRRILNSPALGQIREHLPFVTTALIVLFAVQGIAFFTRSYLFGLIGQKVVAKLRGDLFAALTDREILFYDTQRGGDLLSRISADTALLQDAVSLRFSVLIRYSLQVIVGTVLMALLSWRLTLAIIVLVPLLVGISFFLGRKLRTQMKRQQAALGQAVSIADETLAGIRTVRAFAQEKNQVVRFRAALAEVLTAGTSRVAIGAFFSSFVSFLLNAAMVGVLAYGVLLVTGGALALGDLTAFLLYGLIVAVSFAFLASSLAELNEASGAAERIFELIDFVPPLSPASNRTPANPVQGAVEFERVSFAYPSRPNQAVLDEVSFSAAPGKWTALVGMSGAGKTTLISLIMGFYRPDRGDIRFDGASLEDLNATAVRQHIALVSQEPHLFGVSLADNIRFGKPDATQAEIQAVCEAANLTELLKSLPQGLDTFVGERGYRLSGGERQRVAIARALLKNPRLLILDEATSALDSRNESQVQEAVRRLLPGRTVIQIAHRLATVKEANAIVVLDGGRVIQQGTHQTLTTQVGLYQALALRQEL